MDIYFVEITGVGNLSDRQPPFTQERLSGVGCKTVLRRTQTLKKQSRRKNHYTQRRIKRNHGL